MVADVLFAIDSRAATALAISIGLTLFGVLLIASSWGELRGRRKAKVPPAMRPAPADEELERRVLERYLLWGALATLFMSLWLPAYWWREPVRQAEKRAFFENRGIEEGEKLYGELCSNCHGKSAEGGVMPYTINGRRVQYAEPPLRYIYNRYQEAGRSDEEIKQLMYDAINRGRPNTPMPTWGLAFGGPLNSAQVDNLVLFLQDIQVPFPRQTGGTGAALYSANCAICHGERGEGIVGPNLTVAFDRMTPQQVFDTIRLGRINTNRPSMPAWAHLGDDSIRALVDYIRSIQRGS